MLDLLKKAKMEAYARKTVTGAIESKNSVANKL